MSEEGFLSRWSRRKRAADSGRAVPDAPPGDAPAALPSGTAAQPAPAFVPPEAIAPPAPVPPAGAPRGGATTARDDAPADPPFDLASLPSIDSLTAATDIRAFLRQEVPEALKRAALRKAWSLDPAIRDFVGPADYAWDYNAPDGVPGASLDLVGDVREMLAQIFGPEASQQDPASATVPAPPTADAAPEPPATDTPYHPPAAEAATPADAHAAAPLALEQAPEDAAPMPAAAPPRRHGSALPS